MVHSALKLSPFCPPDRKMPFEHVILERVSDVLVGRVARELANVGLDSAQGRRSASHGLR